MKKRMNILLATVLSFVLFSCQEKEGFIPIPDPTAESQSQMVINETDQPIEIRYGNKQLIDFAGFTVFFKEVIEDSRCPEAINCVWDGRAVVELELEGLDNFENVKLSTPNSENDYPNSVHFLNYSVTLLKVNPSPIESIDFPINEYRVVLKIDRSNESNVIDF